MSLFIHSGHGRGSGRGRGYGERIVGTGRRVRLSISGRVIFIIGFFFQLVQVVLLRVVFTMIVEILGEKVTPKFDSIVGIIAHFLQRTGKKHQQG